MVGDDDNIMTITDLYHSQANFQSGFYRKDVKIGDVMNIFERLHGNFVLLCSDMCFSRSQMT